MISKLFKANQIRMIDAETIRRQQIRSYSLMERAGNALFEAMLPYLTAGRHIVVVAGPGNNGGDGLVVARLLHKQNYPVEVVVVRYTDKTSPDFAENYERLTMLGVKTEDFRGELPQGDVYIDALFGTGLNRPASGVAADAIALMNKSGKKIYSIDIPSGMYADRLNAAEDAVACATRVFTIQFPKIPFFFDENPDKVPRWQRVDIGLDSGVINETPTDIYLIDDWRDWMPERPVNADKSYFGHAVLVGGSKGKSGSIRFAAKAAFRLGVGWVTAHVPESVAGHLQTADPEIMVSVGADAEKLVEFPVPDERNTYGIGPGLGTDEPTAEAMAGFLKKVKRPVVIDADGLNILSANKEMLHLVPAGSILTPHAREWERLNGHWENTPDKWEKAKQFALKYRLVLVLKARYTVVTDGHQLRINPTGNPALAKAGSGDVLTGMITGLLTQGLRPLDAVSAAVYMHGQIADEWVKNHNAFALTPQDLIVGLAVAGKF